jgi:hypothetical protein
MQRQGMALRSYATATLRMAKAMRGMAKALTRNALSDNARQ